MFPLWVTAYFLRGEGGGPPVTFPFKSNVPLWQGQTKFFPLLLYPTEQPSWVQETARAVKAFVPVQATITPLLTTEPPTVFSAAFAELLKSSVKLADGPCAALELLEVEQLAIKAAAAVIPQAAQPNFIKSLLSI